MTFFTRLLRPVAIALVASTASAAGIPELSQWPADADPAVAGEKVAEDFFTRKFRYETDREKESLGVIYPEICTWFGALTFAQASHDKALEKRLVEKFHPYLKGDKTHRVNLSGHVDYRMLGSLPLQINLMNGCPDCLEFGLKFADGQWEKTTDDGITTEARYWIDDMYMITILQVQAYRASKETKYLDRASKTMIAYLDRLQQPDGLFYHGPDSKFHWGRGNGWVAVGLADLLNAMPEDHPDRPHLLDGYRKMMARLLDLQCDDGLWLQLLDEPKSWPETSGSAMFTYSFVLGVKNGWLDEKTYAPAARKAWIALARRLDENGRLRDVCIGTDKGFTESYYDKRPRATGDLHGQAAFLWTASALLQ